jgi:hypothetical protein
MPFLSKSRKRKHFETENSETKPDTSIISIANDNDNGDERRKLLEKQLKHKEEILRRLELVQHYKSRKDIQELDELVKKWTLISQKALEELYNLYISTTNEGKNLSMINFINKMKIDPEMVHYDDINEVFKNLA